MTRWPIFLSESRITCYLPTNPLRSLLVIYIYIYRHIIFICFFYMYRYYFPWSVFQISTYVETHFLFRFSWVMSNTYKFLRLKPCSLISCTLRFSLFAKLPWGQPGQEGTTQKHGRLFQTLDIFSFDIFNAFWTPFPKPIWTSKVSYGGRAGKRSFRCLWWAAWREVHSDFWTGQRDPKTNEWWGWWWCNIIWFYMYN